MKKKVIVTAGGLMEYIDDVRVLTNISSGRLGAIIAARLAELRLDDTEIQVYFVHGKKCIMPREISTTFMDSDIKYFETKTAQNAFNTLHHLLTTEDIAMVIHSMAVSDFTFKRDTSIKLKSNDAEGFIEYMRSTITLNPKIISFIKEWSPKTFLVGFKFEVGATKEDLVDLALASIVKNKCDLVIANDKKEMQKHDTHIAHFVYADHMTKDYEINDHTTHGKETIARSIIYFVRKVLF